VGKRGFIALKGEKGEGDIHREGGKSLCDNRRKTGGMTEKERQKRKDPTL